MASLKQCSSSPNIICDSDLQLSIHINSFNENMGAKVIFLLPIIVNRVLLKLRDELL